MMKFFKVYGWVFVFLVALSGFSGKTHANARSIVIEHECSTLDPLDSIFFICTVFRSLISTPLLSQSEKQMELGSYGAESYLVDVDSKSIEFFLHEDAKWSDGTPVVAEDYILTLKRILSNPDALSTVRQFAVDIIGSELCKELNSPECIHGAEILSPTHFKLFFKNLTENNIFWKYNFDDLSPTPSAFWKTHGDSTFNRLDLPTYGVYKLEPSELTWNEALQTEIRLVPDPLSRRKHLQHYSSVTALKRQSWTADLIRERAIEESIPDVILNISGISSKQQEYLRQKGRKSLPPNSVHGTLTALLDRKTLEPDLRDAVALLLDSEEFSSRHSQFSIEATDRLVKNLDSDYKFSNRFMYDSREERLDVAKDLLTGLDISPKSRRKLNLIYDLPRLRVTADLVRNMLRPHGLDVEIHFFKNFNSSEFVSFREKNDIHIELLSWMSTTVINSSYVVDMLRISVLDLLSEPDYEIFQKLEQESYKDSEKNVINGIIAKIDNLLINKGGFAVLGKLNFISLMAMDLCPREDEFYSRNYTVILLPCESL